MPVRIGERHGYETEETFDTKSWHWQRIGDTRGDQEEGNENNDEMESEGSGSHDAGIEPCEEVIENYAAAEPVEDFSSPDPDILKHRHNAKPLSTSEAH